MDRRASGQGRQLNFDKSCAGCRRIDVKMLLMSVYDVLDRLRRGLLVIDPEVGGRIGKWTDEQRSRLIESLIVGIPLPSFYFDASSSGDGDRWIVVDGFRRLMALRCFVGGNGEPGFRLCGLEYLKEFERCRFVDDGSTDGNGAILDEYKEKVEKLGEGGQRTGTFLSSTRRMPVWARHERRWNSRGIDVLRGK